MGSSMSQALRAVVWRCWWLLRLNGIDLFRRTQEGQGTLNNLLQSEGRSCRCLKTNVAVAVAAVELLRVAVALLVGYDVGVIETPVGASELLVGSVGLLVGAVELLVGAVEPLVLVVVVAAAAAAVVAIVVGVLRVNSGSDDECEGCAQRLVE